MPARSPKHAVIVSLAPQAKTFNTLHLRLLDLGSSLGLNHFAELETEDTQTNDNVNCPTEMDFTKMDSKTMHASLFIAMTTLPHTPFNHFKLGQPSFHRKRQAPCSSSHRQGGTRAYTSPFDRYQVHFNNRILDPETIKSPFPKPVACSSPGNSESDLHPEMHLLCSIVTHSCLEHPL